MELELSDIEQLNQLEKTIINENKECLMIQEREKEIKMNIIALADELEAIEINNATLNQSSKSGSEGQYGEVTLSEKELKDQLKASQKFQTELKDEVKRLENQFSERSKEIEQLEKEQSHNRSTQNKEIPAVKSTLALYKHISLIRFNDHGTDDNVNGYVTNTNGLKTFSLNKKENSQHYITNYLWDLMETD